MLLIDGEYLVTFLMERIAQKDGSESRCTELATLASIRGNVVITKASKDFEVIDRGCFSIQ